MVRDFTIQKVFSLYEIITARFLLVNPFFVAAALIVADETPVFLPYRFPT